MITEAEIGKILFKEKLVFKKTIRTSNRFVLILAGSGEGDIVLKILRDSRRTFAKIALRKEAAVLKILNQAKNLKLKVPKFFGENFKGKYPYYKEEHIKGEILERKEGFFFRKLTRKEVKKIIDFLSFLNKIEISSIKKHIPNLSDFGSGYFDFALRFHKEEINFFLSEFQIAKLFDLIEKTKEALSLKNLAAVHGEIYPNNLMKNKKGQIFLLDWENIGLGSPAHDVASVYLRLKDKNLSEYLLKNLDFSRQKYFSLYFQLEMILQSLGSLSFFERAEKMSPKIRKEAKKYFLEKINDFCKNGPK